MIIDVSSFLLGSNDGGYELCPTLTKPIGVVFEGGRTLRPLLPGLELPGHDLSLSLFLGLLEGCLGNSGSLCFPLCLPTLGNILDPLAGSLCRLPLAVFAFAAGAAPASLLLPLALTHKIIPP